MSIAWKCDICGALYESDKDGYTNFIRLGLVNSNDYCCRNNGGGSFHICPSCNSAVKKVLDDLGEEHNGNTSGEVKDGVL